MNNQAVLKDQFPTFRRIPSAFRASSRELLSICRRGTIATGRFLCLPVVRRSFALFVLAAIVAYIAFALLVSYSLNRDLAAMRQKGELLTPAEMAPSPVPDSRNAALVYTRAFLRTHLDNEQSADLFDFYWSVNHNAVPGAISAAVVKRNMPAVALARQAARIPECRYPLDYASDDPETNDGKYVFKMRRLAMLVGVTAIQEASNGRTDQALSDVRVIFAIGKDANQPGFTIQVLESQIIDKVGYTTLAAVLDRAPLTSAQATLANAMLPNIDWKTSIKSAVRDDTSRDVRFYNRIRRNPPPTSTNWNDIPDLFAPYRLPLGLWSPWSKMDEMYYLHYQDESLQAVDNPGQYSAILSNFTSKRPLYAMVGTIIAPAYSTCFHNSDELSANRAMAQAAIALNRYRALNHDYPATLNQAFGSSPLPANPYSDQPVVYRRVGAGYLLYCAGQNGIGDGGKPIGSQSGADDVVWQSTN